MARTTQDIASEGAERREPLDEYARSAPSPIMRGLARIAIARGFRQESLAKALKERPGLSGIQAANVQRHFRSRNPRRDTVAEYASVLGISDDQLHVIEHGRLPEDREERWERQLFRTLSVFETEFESGTDAAIRDALLDNETRSRVLAAMTLPSNEPDDEWSSIPVQLRAAAAALMPTLDLRERVASESPMLFKIYVDAIELFGSPAKAQAYIRACSAMLELEGIDTQPMRNYLRRRTRDTPEGFHEVMVIDGSSVITKTYAADPWARFKPQERQMITEISKPAVSRRKGDNA